jgi:hypothetical protein
MKILRNQEVFLNLYVSKTCFIINNYFYKIYLRFFFFLIISSCFIEFINPFNSDFGCNDLLYFFCFFNKRMLISFIFVSRKLFNRIFLQLFMNFKNFHLVFSFQSYSLNILHAVLFRFHLVLDIIICTNLNNQLQTFFHV